MIYRRLYILCMLVAMMVSCGRRSSDDAFKPIAVRTLVLTDTSLIDRSPSSSLQRVYMGSVEEGSNASLSFPLGGQVSGVYVSEGDRVTKGQRLIGTNSSDAEASLSAARAQLNQARDAYNRVKTVYDAGGVSEVKWVDIQTKLAQAQSLYDVAAQNVSNCMLTAPFDGVVGELNVVAGDHLLPGQVVAKILDINKLCVSFCVPEQEIRLLNTGDIVSVDCLSLGKTFRAEIQDKSPIANRVSHSYKVRVRLFDSDREMLPGMNCKVRVSQTNMSGYVLPGRAVLTYRDGLYCWVVRDGCAQRIPIKSSAFVNNGVVVSSGVKSGDVVVVEGYQKLYNGVRVAVE